MAPKYGCQMAGIASARVKFSNGLQEAGILKISARSRYFENTYLAVTAKRTNVERLKL